VLSERPNLIMVRDYRMAWTLLGLSHLHRTPLVFEAHNLPSLEMGELDGEGRWREVRRLVRLERSVFRRARLVVTITERLRSRVLERYRPEPGRAVCVPDASRAPTVAEAKAGGLGQPPTFVYAGQLYPWKGVDVLLRALPLVPTARLEIVGGMQQDAQRERLRQLADELGVGDRVEFLGPVPYAEVPRYLARADAALLPLAAGPEAREFTSPLKLFDYLAAGLPVIAADFPTIREIVRDGENGLLFRPGDEASLAGALGRLSAEPELASSLRREALTTARDFTWQRRAQRLDCAFRTALGQLR
ncbi:MAG: glycosyltransferase family 4 protein, partial [Chloroflexi bacterium]|nr:glycosyltransferase family 4 protein [Chloroflexota bacterium]